MILDEIVTSNRKALEERKRFLPLAELEKTAFASPPPRDFAVAISKSGLNLIAEVKKASPSRGVMRDEFDPVGIARKYVRCGASAISVLTESAYFQGSLNNLSRIRFALMGEKTPLLRKDFIVDPYQVFESRVYGADAILLIVAILSPAELRRLLEISHSLGMACLVEVHNEKEVAIAIESGARVIGINNRDLTTFKVDIETTSRLRPRIPGDRVVVSESGIKERRDTDMLKRLDVNAVLIGEAFMTAPDIADKIKELFFDQG